MPMAQTVKARRETLNLRIQPELRGLIDRAAELTLADLREATAA